MLEVLQSFSDVTWILTVIIGLFTLFTVKHILQVRSLPPGPFPLPFLGNILAFRGKDVNPKEVIKKLSQQHKDMFTLWLGPRPTIFVCSWELVREGLVVKKNDFSGRVIRLSGQILNGDHQDIVSQDFGPCWETLRKILTGAVRKYAVSEKLSELVSDVVDMAADHMLKEGKPVNAGTYSYLIVYNILASSAFGQRFELDDPEFVALTKINDEVNEEFGSGLPSDFLPLLRWFYRKREQKFTQITNGFKDYIRKKFNEHKSTYKSGTARDFTDAMLAAREEAEAEGKDSLEHLTDGNMNMLLLDFFLAGTDTTRITLNWLLLYICQHPDVQNKIHHEIDEQIGSRSPCQSDRTLCAYTYSVITEILRVRPVLDFTLEHKAICDTQLGGYKIPKDTSVFFNFRTSHENATFWEEPDKFIPERFLDPDGRLNQARLSGYLPFGLGRRACPGEKLALADLFLIVTRLFQKHSFELENGPGTVSLAPEPIGIGNRPESFNIIIKRRLTD